MNVFPKYFRHTNREKLTTDCLFVRHDDAISNAVVITSTGKERPINTDKWPLRFTLFMVQLGEAEEMTEEQAKDMLQKSITE